MTRWLKWWLIKSFGFFLKTSCMISRRILVSSQTEWWVMKKEAATAAYKLMDILQMYRKDPEKTWLKDHQRHAGGPLHSWSSQSRLCESHKRHSCHLFCLTFFCSCPLAASFAHWVSCRGSRPEAEGYRGMWGPALGLDQSALQWFLLFGVCVFPEKSQVNRLPPVLCVKHTRIHTNRCHLNVNWCECSALASRQRHQWISK